MNAQLQPQGLRWMVALVDNGTRTDALAGMRFWRRCDAERICGALNHAMGLGSSAAMRNQFTASKEPEHGKTSESPINRDVPRPRSRSGSSGLDGSSISSAPGKPCGKSVARGVVAKRDKPRRNGR